TSEESNETSEESNETSEESKNKSEEFAHFLGSKSEISTEEFGQFLGRKSDKLAFIVHAPCPEADLRRMIDLFVARDSHIREVSLNCFYELIVVQNLNG
uniref:hypothetical protein n=1 Tax=Porphyromonas uenonis TaxID=281920 RepID=UPI001EE274D6